MKTTSIKPIGAAIVMTMTVSTLMLLSAQTGYGTAIAPYIYLGSAGPNSLAVLDYGNFSLSFNPATATINGVQVVEGAINGNVAVYNGNVSTSTSGQLNGDVYLGPSASGYSGANAQLSSGIPAAALTTAFGSSFGPSLAPFSGGAAAYYHGQTADFSSAPSAGTVAPGVYDLSSWTIHGGTYSLAAGEVYVFNITGDFKLDQAAQFLSSTPGYVIFNVGGNVSTSGGLNNPGEVEIQGVVMAQGSISLTPGYVSPEIISDKSINIASGGGVQGTTTVPDGGMTAALLGLALLGMGGLSRKLCKA